MAVIRGRECCYYKRSDCTWEHCQEVNAFNIGRKTVVPVIFGEDRPCHKGNVIKNFVLDFKGFCEGNK